MLFNGGEGVHQIHVNQAFSKSRSKSDLENAVANLGATICISTALVSLVVRMESVHYCCYDFELTISSHRVIGHQI